MPSDNKPIPVALIGAAGVVIAALIGYLATRPNKVEPVFIDYTGIVKDKKSLNPIPNAHVAITEDQKPPQRFDADSNGIFHGQVSKDTRTMVLDVKADGYKGYSANVPTIRSGSEPILLEPLRLSVVEPQPPPSLPQRDPYQEELRKLRRLHKVSLINRSESGRTLDEMPKNSYGFEYGERLTLKGGQAKPEIEKDELKFELHKVSDGHVELVGYVGPETFTRLRKGIGAGEQFSIYASPWSDGHNLVSIPMDELSCSGNRRIDLDASNTISFVAAVDCSAITGIRWLPL